MILEIYRYSSKIGEVNLAQDVPIDQLSSSEIIIGRSDEAAVVLNDRMVSREHAKLKVENYQWKISSCGGTISVNGSGLQESAINNGDSISIGPFALVVRINEEELRSLQGDQNDLSEINTDLNIDIVHEDETETKLAGEGELDIPDGPTNIEIVDVDEAPTEEVDSEASENDGEQAVDEFGGEDEFGGVDEFGGEEQYDGGGENSEFADVDSFESNEEYEGGEYDEYGEGDYDDQYAVAEGDDDSTRVLSGFANYYLEILGEYAPYDNYSIDQNEIYIGRHSEKCQIVLNDPEVSSVHACLHRKGSVIELEDMQSGNGTLVNGERINRVTLQNGDEFVIGSTSFSLKIKSSFLKDEINTLMPVEENQSIEVEEILEVNEDDEDFDDIEGGADFEADSETSPLKKMWNDPKKRPLLIGAVGIFLFMMFWPEDKPKPKPIKPKAEVKKDAKNQLDPKKQQRISQLLKIAQELVLSKKYEEALQQIEILLSIDPKNNEGLVLKNHINETLKDIALKEQELRREEEKRLLQEKVKKLVADAKEAVKERNVPKAKGLFQKIAELDPDNFDLPLMKNDLSAWEAEQDRKRVEEAQKKAERERQVNALDPGKKFYLRKEWYKATLKLESFLELKGIDDDLVKEATNMLKEARDNLERVVSPLVGKARSLKEGQDLKGAYEIYSEVLKFDPTHRESLNEMNRIRDVLFTRSKKVYREAIVSESLSLFDEAKEKFQEVQQISPSDGKYYKMATDKLKEYID